jgi:hypothetical protein
MAKFKVALWKTMGVGFVQEVELEVEATKETAFEVAVKTMQEGGNPMGVTMQWGGKISPL